MSNSLTLKWGTVKGYNLETDEAKAAMQKWAEHGVSMSAIAQHTVGIRSATLPSADRRIEL